MKKFICLAFLILCLAGCKPVILIFTPIDGATFDEGAEITFVGFAVDLEDLMVGEDLLIWTSDRDGEIGTGTQFTVDDLSSGTHIITVTAMDSDGEKGVDAFTITIGDISDVTNTINFREAGQEYGLDDVGVNAASLAFADYDNDEDLDIYVNTETQGDEWTNRLWENDGAGHFTNVAAQRGVDHSGLGRGLSWGDYDNDGDLDLLVMAMDETGAETQRPAPPPMTKLYKNMLAETGEPNFTDVTVEAGILRKDNDEDLKRGGIVVTGAGAAWGDYNNDGYLDLYLKYADYFEDPPIENTLFKNNGDGTFTDVTEELGVTTVDRIDKTNSQGSPNWVDYDNDGDLDLLVTNEGDKNLFFQNKGDGTFLYSSMNNISIYAPFRNPGDCNGACWGDIDNDGDLDCYLVNADQRNRLIRNNLIETGEASFTDITKDPETGEFSVVGDYGGGRGCTMGDYDNDGDLDIYVNNGGTSNQLINDVIEGMPEFVQFYIAWEPAVNKLFSNNGDSTFTDVTDLAGVRGMGIGSGVASGDINEDGFLDIYVMNRTYYASDYTSTPVHILQQNFLFLNEGNDNNWIKVKLVGITSNKNGIGAHVKVTSGDLTQLREVTSSHGYNSQDDLPVEFGLGKRTTVDTIEVTWPAGTAQTLNNVDINQMVTIEEAS